MQVAVTIFVGSTTLLSLSGRADIIDLSNIPHGTPVSFNNPYAGVLVIHGEGTAHVQVGPGQFDFATFAREATIVSFDSYGITFPEGAIQALYTGPLMGPGQYGSQITIDFLQPVTEISFGLASWRGGGFRYFAVNSSGTVITGSDGLDPGLTLNFAFTPFSVQLPDGYHFTALNFRNSDPNPPNGAVWVNNIGFRVPEQGSTCLFMVLGALTLYGTRRLAWFHPGNHSRVNL